MKHIHKPNQCTLSAEEKQIEQQKQIVYSSSSAPNTATKSQATAPEINKL